MKYLLLFSLFLVAAKGCGDKEMKDVTTVAIGEKATLKIGEMLHVEGSTKDGFRFSSVENDSRCPKGVNCIQAGSVTILVEEMNAKSQQVNIPADIARSGKIFDIEGAKVKVLSVDPYPVNGQGAIKQEDYSLTIMLMEGNPKMK